MGEPKPVRAWALFTSNGHIFTDSCRRTRREVVHFANHDCAPTWDWDRYRRNGFRIRKIEIRPIEDTERAE